MDIEEDIKWIENLAKIELTPEEKEKYEDQLIDILDYFKKLEELDTDKIEPMKHVLEIKNVLREDEPKERLSPDEALSNAPQSWDDYFQVPKVI